MPATVNQVREVLRNYLKAWDTEDRALFLSLFAEDARWADPAGTPEYEGQAGLARFWDHTHADPDRTYRSRLEEIRACGHEGLLRFTMELRVSSRNEGLDLSAIDYFVLNDAGKIQLGRAFFDESSASIPNGLKPFAPEVPLEK